jgi:uncharacterized phiE125 gp8 family phage protein
MSETRGLYYTGRGGMVYAPYLDAVVAPRPDNLPEVAPISRDQVKLQARVDDCGDEEDALIDLQLAAAVNVVETHTGRKMGQVAIDAHLDGFPYYGLPIALPWGHVQSVTEVAYRLDGEDETVWSADDYVLERFAERSSVRPKAGCNYPGVTDYRYGRDRQAVRIRYVAGFAAAADIPVAMRQAALMVAAEFYIEREAHRVQPGVIAIANPAAMSLMRAHRIHWPV